MTAEGHSLDYVAQQVQSWSAAVVTAVEHWQSLQCQYNPRQCSLVAAIATLQIWWLCHCQHG